MRLQEEDWSIALLHQDVSDTAEGSTRCTALMQLALNSHVGTRLLYMLTLVRNKRDSSVRRGAIVKGLAIVTARIDMHHMQA